MALPPGAAQASSTRWPGNGCKSGAASCAPRSWTENAPAIESRQRAHTHRGFDEDSRIACRRRIDPRGSELRQQRVPRRDVAVDAKRERRLRVARGEHVLPVVREFALHALDPPSGMRPACDRIGNYGLFQRLALPHEATQQRIDERLGGRTRQYRGRVHRVIDDGERRRARVQELIDRHSDETAQRRIGNRLRRERAHQRIEPAPVPQRAVSELLDECPAAAGRALLRRRELREGSRQCRSVQYALDRKGG